MSEHSRGAGYPLAYECFRFDSEELPQLFPVKPESHYFSEVIMVRSGVCRVTRGSLVCTLHPGELIYISPLIRHAIDSADGKPVVYDAVKFSVTRLQELPAYLAYLRSLSIDAAKVHLPIYMTVEDVNTYHMGDIIRECLYEAGQNDFMSDLHIRALIYLLVSGLARFWTDKRKSFADLLSRPHNPIMDIPSYIEQHIAEPLRVEDLAERCSLSYPWFAKRFHEFFGMSCKQCIERLRVEAVEHYLAYSDLYLADISSRTGYTDCSHMVKDFRRMTGMTPGQYRSLMKSQGRAAISAFSEQTSPIHPSKY